MQKTLMAHPIRGNAGRWFHQVRIWGTKTLGLFLLLSVVSTCTNPELDFKTFTLEPGLIIEQLDGTGYGLAAGLQNGDIVLAFDGGNGQEPLTSPFQWYALTKQVKTAPSVTGERAKQAKHWQLPKGFWGMEVTPRFSGPSARAWSAYLASGEDPENGQKLLERLADSALAHNNPEIACWLQIEAAASETEGTWTEVFASALQTAEQLPHSHQVLVHARIGEYLQKQGRFYEAQEAYQRALQLDQQDGSDHLLRARLHDKLAQCAYLSEQLDAIATHLPIIEKMSRKLAPSSLFLAEMVTRLGVYASVLGRGTQEINYYREAIAICETQGFRGSLRKLYANLGSCYIPLGDLASAETYTLKSLKLAQEYDQVDKQFSALNNLGNIANTQKEFDRAHSYYQQALQVAKQLEDVSRLIQIYNNLGTLADELHQDKAALEYFSEALRLQRDIARGGAGEAQILVNIAHLEIKTQAWQKARKHLDQALAIFDQKQIRDANYAYALEALGAYHQSLSEYPAALDAYTRAGTLLQEQLPDSQDLARNRNILGRFYQAWGKHREATAYFEAAIEALEGQIGKLGGGLIQRQYFTSSYADLYRDLVENRLMMEEGPHAFFLWESFRAQHFRRMLGQRVYELAPSKRLREQGRQLTSDAMALERQLSEQGQNENTKRALKALEQRREKLRQSRRKEAPRVAQLEAPSALGAEAIQASLEPGTLLLSFLTSKDQTHLFALSASKPLSMYTLPIGRQALENRISNFRRDLMAQKAGPRHRQALAVRGHELYLDLLAPLEDLLEQADHLLIIPDGPLHALPFAALVTKQAAQGQATHLLENQTLYFAASASTHVQSMAQNKRVSQKRSLIAFGDPKFVDKSLEAIPATRTEVERIGELFHQPEIFLGKQATVSRALAESHQASILHFATHGLFKEEAPLDSGLVLTADEKHEQGLLSAWEIVVGMRLNCELVTLSGCHTASGKDMGNEGLLGLTQAFRYAGAQSVLASLWQVADQPTARLMVRFYEMLAGGMPKDQALRQAQLEMEKAGAHPFQWAGFVLMGERR